MAEKLLKETKDAQVKKKRTKKAADEENIEIKDVYKIDFGQEEIDRKKPAKTATTKATRTRSKKNVIKVVEDKEDDDPDEIFGNINKWLTEEKLEEEVKKTRKKKLTKIEEGIKSSKNKVAKAKKETKTTRTKKAKNIVESEEIEEPSVVEEELIRNSQDEIKIHAENGVTEIILKQNNYRIELQKNEYDIYTEKSDTSYIIVRDAELRIGAGDVYILLKKQDEDYEITTNQDFKINYVIDNLTRRDNVVNFKLTNLTEIVAGEDGLTFEIDEEKVIENNLEDNRTLVISEEDGKVYLPYTKEDIKREVAKNKGTRITDIIENKYVLPINQYKNSIKARFREGYNLMYKKEGKSRRSAILLGIELMFETNLHPAIISACKNLEELDIYLDCLEDNELEKFSCFKIIYKSLPKLRKKAKFQEF